MAVLLLQAAGVVRIIELVVVVVLVVRVLLRYQGNPVLVALGYNYQYQELLLTMLAEVAAALVPRGPMPIQVLVVWVAGAPVDMVVVVLAPVELPEVRILVVELAAATILGKQKMVVLVL